MRGFGYAFGLLLSAGSIPFVIRHLGVEDFGRFVLVTAIITLVGGLTEVGLQSVGLREYSSRIGTERDRLMANLLGVRIALTLAGAAGAMVFVLVAGYDRILVAGTALASAGLMIQSVQSLLAVPLAAQLRLGWITVAEVGRQIIVVTCTLGLVVVGAELLPFFLVTIPAGVFALLLTAGLVRGLIPFRPHFDLGEWWVLLRDTVAYAVAIAVNTAYFRIAIVIMSLLATERETGYFAASFRVIEVLLPIPALVVGAAFPILARAARDDASRLGYATQRIFDVAVLGGVAIVLGLELAAPDIMAVLAGDEGRRSVDVLRLQAPALLGTFLAVACGFTLLSLRRHREMLWANLVALAFCVGLTLSLVPLLGAEGAAIATTVAELALGTITAVLLVHAMPEWTLSTKVVLPAIAGAGLGAMALLLPVPSVAQAGVALITYVAVLMALRAVPPEMVDAVRAVRRRPA